jgi:hypothetical protein
MKVRFALVLATAGIAVLTFAMPSGATVHEIIGQWCSGRGELGPAGISDPTKRNFAQPLFASGVATFVPNFDGQGNNLVRFNFDHPAIKVVSLGFNVQIGPGLFITAWTTNDDFPAFRNCRGYVGGSVP